MSKLALFDFDGTITNRDTLIEFTRFVTGTRRFYFGMTYLGLPLIFHKIGFIESQRAKEIFLSHFFAGYPLADFNKHGQQFGENVLPAMIRPAAMKQIDALKKDGYRVIVVSASASNWIEPWTKQAGVELISTRLETVNDLLTGKISGRNCNADEKVNRIREVVDLSLFNEIVAYGDTSGDIPMLKLATTSHFKPFRDKT